MYKLIVFAFTLHLSIQLNAQQVQIETIIQTANNDPKLTFNQNTANFISRQNYNLPWIREAKVRLGINGNATKNRLDGYLRNEDYYAVKISPNALRERKYQKALKPAQYDLYLSKDGVLLQEAIFDRYQSIVNLYFALNISREKSRLKPFLNKKSLILNQMLDQGLDIKVKDVVDVEYDKNDLGGSLIEYQNAIIEEAAKINSFLNSTDSIQVNFDEFINIETIGAIVSSVDTNYVNYIPEIKYTDQKTQLSFAEWQYQKSKNRQIFSYFQAGYSPLVVTEEAKTKFNASNDLTFRIGLSVPIASNNNLKRSESAIKWYEDQNEAARLREKYKISILLQRTKVLQLIEAKRAWQKLYKESLIPKLLSNETLKAQITSLEIVDMEISVIKLQLQGLKLDEKITNEYLELMNMTGALNDTERNFLLGSGE